MLQKLAEPSSEICRFVGQHRDSICILLGLLVFYGTAGWYLELPGLMSDEARGGKFAMQMLLTNDVDWMKFSIFGKHLFVALAEYETVFIPTYAIIPFFEAFGIGVVTLRAFSLLYSGFALVPLYYFCKEFLGRRHAAISILLVATFPTFVFLSRFGVWAEAMLTLFTSTSLLLFYRWFKTGSRRYLAAGMFTIGLGLNIKLLFLWFIVALAIASIVILRNKAHGKNLIATITPWFTVTAVGASPWLFVLAVTKAQFIRANIVTTSAGVNNLNVVHNLGLRLVHIYNFTAARMFWFFGGLYENPVFAVFFVLSIVYLAVSWIRGRSRKELLLLLSTFLIVLQSAFTLSGLGELHLFILVPFIIIPMALLVDRVWTRSRAVGVIVLLLLVTTNLVTVTQYYGAVVRTGGLFDASSATYELADYLVSRNYTTPFAVDWGFSDNLPVVTSNRVRPVDIYSYNDSQKFKESLPALLSSNNVFLFHSPAFTVVERLGLFQEVVSSSGRTVILQAVFRTRDGTPAILVYSVASPLACNGFEVETHGTVGSSLQDLPFEMLMPNLGRTSTRLFQQPTVDRQLQSFFLPQSGRGPR